MRILFVSSHYPADLRTGVYGVFKRMGMFVEALGQIADSLDLLFYVPPETALTPAYRAQQSAAFASQWGGTLRLHLAHGQRPIQGGSPVQDYLAPALGMLKQGSYRFAAGEAQRQAFEACLDAGPDLVFVHRLYAMGPVLTTRRSLPPVLLDLDEIEHLWFLRSLRQPPHWRAKPLLHLQVPALWLGEWRALRRVERAFLSSAADRDRLQRWWRLGNVVAIPNAVAIPAAFAPPAAEPVLLLLGSYRYTPNAIGADFLILRIWPAVRAAVPAARLIIAGEGPEALAAFRDPTDGVEFTGFVDDIAALYRRTRIVCCPILSGGGTRLKLIEAAAHGRPIVSTTIGAEGLDIVDGRHGLLRDDPESFATACIELLRDDARCGELAAQARRLAVERYDRSRIVEQIAGQIRECLPRTALERAGQPA